MILSLSVLRTLGMKNILHNTPNKEMILPPDALYDLLILVLAQALKVTKERTSEKEVILENLTG